MKYIIKINILNNFFRYLLENDLFEKSYPAHYYIINIITSFFFSVYIIFPRAKNQMSCFDYLLYTYFECEMKNIFKISEISYIVLKNYFINKICKLKVSNSYIKYIRKK